MTRKRPPSTEDLARALHELKVHQEELQAQNEELRRAQAALEQSEEHYRWLADNASDVIWVLDLESRRYRYMSPSVERLLGYTPGQVLALPLGATMTAEAAEQIERVLPEALDRFRQGDRALGRTEAEHRRQDGTTVWTETVARLVRNEQTGRIEVHGVSRDITDRRRAEEALRESEARFRALFKNSPDALSVSTLEGGRIEEINDSFEALFGCSREDVVGQASLGLFADPSDRVRLIEQLGRSGRLAGVQVQLRRKNGEVFSASLSAVVTRVGGRDCLVSVLRDVTERLRAEERNRLLSEMLDEAPAGIIVHDAEGTVLWANRHAAQLHGYSLEELLRVPLSGLNPPEDHTLMPSRFERIERDGDASFEARHVRRDGMLLPLRIRSKKVSWHGRPAILSVQTDLTEYRRAEEATRLAHERLRTFVDSNIVGVHVSSPAGQILEANDYYLDLIGATREQLERGELDWRAITPSEWLRADEKCIEALRAGSFCAPYEKEYLLRSGARAAVFLVRAMLPGPGEQMATFLLDITARRHAAERLRVSEAQLRSILDNLQDAYLMADAEGRLTLVSPSAPFMFGYDSIAEMIGLPAEEIYADRRVRDAVLQQLRDSGGVSDWVGEGRRKDGSTFWVSASFSIRRDSAGRVVETEGLVRDISERRRADEERRQLQASVAQADRLASMGMLAAGVAHEINNPLAYSLYHLETLCEELPGLAHQLADLQRALRGKRDRSAKALDPALWADVVERLSEAVGGMRKIQQIAQGLSSFSRVEEDRLERVELRHPIESALSIAWNEIKYRARVDKDLGATAPVLGNEGKLSQVFLNLLVNAAHAIREGDAERNRILIRTWQEGATVLAEVRDTGAGIAPENLERIFEPFYSTKPIGMGSGLGLSIVRNILAAMGGSIEVTSQVGAGSRFVIRLPAAAPESEGEERKTPSGEVSPTSGRVLVIDDDAGIRNALRRILRDHQVVEVDSGERAREVLSTDQHFDVILCDMMMPNLSGMDLYGWLVEHHPALAASVVFVTGGAFTPHTREFLEGVTNPRLTKPFDRRELQQLVAERVLARGSRNP